LTNRFRYTFKRKYDGQIVNINNILESGHHFTNNEVSLKFRFRLLNTIMLIIVLTSTIFGILHYLNISKINDFHANVNFFFAVSNLLFIYYLRYLKSSYKTIVLLMLFSSLLTFTSDLLTVVNDEFRIMWFYITVFLAFFTGGVVYGYITMLLSIFVILTCNALFDLYLSELSIVTAITGLLIMSYSVKVYTQKMIDLEKTLLSLNNSLHHKVDDATVELQKKDAYMLQQARLAQMGEMIAMIAHQWRQPLSSIAAITTNLKISMSLGDDIKPEQLEYDLSAIENRIELLSKTIDDFRNFYKTDGQKRSFDLDKAIHQSLDVLSPAIMGANVHVDFKNYLKKPIVSYESEVIQVIMNLVKNAVDILKEKEGPREIYVNSYEDDRFAYIVVEDNGGGVASEHITKIFEPYFSTKKEKNGMGLGLYMSHLIIYEHCKGTLEVENTSKGALFKVKIPLAI